LRAPIQFIVPFLSLHQPLPGALARQEFVIQPGICKSIFSFSWIFPAFGQSPVSYRIIHFKSFDKP